MTARGTRDGGLGGAGVAAKSTSGLVRLLAAVATLAEILQCDMVCDVEIGRDGLVVTRSCGISTDDSEASRQWPLGPVARDAIVTASPVTRASVSEGDLPATLRDRAGCAGAWVPLAIGSEATGELLVLLRDGADPFSSSAPPRSNDWPRPVRASHATLTSNPCSTMPSCCFGRSPGRTRRSS
jgi:hypothetical protein